MWELAETKFPLAGFGAGGEIRYHFFTMNTKRFSAPMLAIVSVALCGCQSAATRQAIHDQAVGRAAAAQARIIAQQAREATKGIVPHKPAP